MCAELHEMALDGGLEEALNVSRLSLEFPNVVGVMHDDVMGAIESGGYTRDDCAQIREAVKSHNPALNLYATAYTHELGTGKWQEFGSYVDGVFLWTWRSEDLFDLDERLDQCCEEMGDKPIVLGCYMRDYPMDAPVPMERLKHQWERIPGYLEAGKITGYCMLGAYLIDWQPEQAEWIRDFIAAG